MKVSKSALAGVAVVVMAAGVAAQGMPPLPKPGPEHEILKMDVGVGTQRSKPSRLRARRR